MMDKFEFVVCCLFCWRVCFFVCRCFVGVGFGFVCCSFVWFSFWVLVFEFDLFVVCCW